MEALNFDGVVATADKQFTRPGTIDIFEIKKVEFGKSKNKGTAGMTCTFENEDSSFNDTFYLQGSTADKTKVMLGRVQALYSYVFGEDAKLTGNVTPDQIVAKLTGKKLALKVGGEVSNTGKGYAKLGFAGFGAMADQVTFLKFNADEQKMVQNALDAIEASRTNRADSEGSAPSGELAETFPEVNAPSENF